MSLALSLPYKIAGLLGYPYHSLIFSETFLSKLFSCEKNKTTFFYKMKSFICNFFVVLTIALPIFAYSANNYTCGVEGFCSESVIIESQHQGIVFNPFREPLVSPWEPLGALGIPWEHLGGLRSLRSLGSPWEPK